MSRTLLLISVLMCGACATTKAVEDTAQTVVADGYARLSIAVKPLAYALDLTIDPRNERFQGVVEIQVEIPEPLHEFVIHGEALTIGEATAKAGELTIPLRVEAGEHGGLLVRSEAALSGKLTLHMTYDGPLPEALDGLYRTQVGDRWFAFTQFEPMDARHAFPCFDEPVFKTPFTTTMRVPEAMAAFTNTPEVSAETVEGWNVVRFATSKPLPTYLVAFAVGDIVARAAPTEETDGIPTRILAVRGREQLADWALDRVPGILGAVSDYFGEPLPYAKLDLIGVPNFGAGAMENVGLVTFRERLLLIDPERVPPQAIEYGLSVIAHELAHMWFGNLVTMPWWDDLWLNEAFATWFEGKITAQIEPSLETAAADVLGAQWVMGLDVKRHARAIREPVAHGGDAHNAFDGITYVKGAAILGMTEAWMGEAPMRTGLRAYMAKHAHGNGTTQDLFEALDGATNKPVSAVLASFTDQPGVPRVDVSLHCEGPPKVTLRQERHVRWESDLERDRTWKIPVCFRYPVNGQVTSHCALMEGPEMEVALQGETCPLWLHPNPDELGYYRWSLPEAQLRDLAGSYRVALTLREKITLLPGMWALVTANKLPVATYLAAVDDLAEEEHPLVVSQVASALSALGPHARALGLEAELARIARARMKSHVTRIGTERKDKETARTTMLRSQLRSVMADVGRDPDLREQARATTDAFLADTTQVPEGLGTALKLAAWDGDARLFERYMAALETAVTPQVRGELVSALGNFSDPALTRRGLDAVLDGPLKSQDMGSVYRSTGRMPETRQAAWAWFETRYDEVMAKMGAHWAVRAPRVASALCDPELRGRLVTFFEQGDRMPPGAERNLGLALERIDECLNDRARMQEPLRSYLRAR